MTAEQLTLLQQELSAVREAADYTRHAADKYREALALCEQRCALEEKARLDLEDVLKEEQKYRAEISGLLLVAASILQDVIASGLSDEVLQRSQSCVRKVGEVLG